MISILVILDQSHDLYSRDNKDIGKMKLETAHELDLDESVFSEE